MTKPKWNHDDVFKFLGMYEKYSVLWNIKHHDYLNRNMKIQKLEKLESDLIDCGLAVDTEQLRIKIKSIRDAYRQEVGIILISKKSGSGTDDIYYPS